MMLETVEWSGRGIERQHRQRRADVVEAGARADGPGEHARELLCISLTAIVRGSGAPKGAELGDASEDGTGMGNVSPDRSQRRIERAHIVDGPWCVIGSSDHEATPGAATASRSSPTSARSTFRGTQRC